MRDQITGTERGRSIKRELPDNWNQPALAAWVFLHTSNTLLLITDSVSRQRDASDNYQQMPIILAIIITIIVMIAITLINNKINIGSYS